MNLKLKAALLTLCVILGFAGLAFIISIFPTVVLMLSGAAIVVGIGMIGNEQ